jgi:hypothetical protein
LLGEEYIGGFTSGNLIRGRLRGYGLYITTSRVIGVKSRKAAAGFLLGAAIGGAVGYAVGQKLSRDDGAKMIQDLEGKKDFELQKSDVQKIELKKPRWYKTGHILFTPKYGEPVKIKVGHKRDFGKLRDLMQKFDPEALVIVD